MKQLILFSLCSLLNFTACTDDEDVCVLADNPVCQETVPTNEICQAAFQRWFYDAATQKCEEIGYSGCSQIGFATREACEACDCE